MPYSDLFMSANVWAGVASFTKNSSYGPRGGGHVAKNKRALIVREDPEDERGIDRGLR